MANDLLRLSRRIHLYFGLLIAPSLLFFALTGATQMLSLHEGAPGSPYRPPAWLASLAQLHKNATLTVTKRPAAPAAGQPKPDAGARPGGDTGGIKGQAAQPARPPLTLEAKQKQHLPMKIFFLIVAVGLATSTVTGVYMAFRYERRPWVVSAWLAAGVLVPLLLTRF